MSQTFSQSGPGPKTLIGGNMVLGFFGEVSATELLTTSEYRALTGLTAGTDTAYPVVWLKFIVDNKIIYTTKQPMIDRISYNDLVSKKLIHGETNIALGDRIYSTRVPRGSLLELPNIFRTNDQHVDTYNSEWNRLFYPIIDRPGVSDDGYAFGIFAKYTEDELGMGMNPSRVTICREKYSKDLSLIVTRGYTAATIATTSSPTTSIESYVFRPIIESDGEIDLAVNMSFIDLKGMELSGAVDIGLKNNISLDFTAELTEAGAGAKGNLYINDKKIGEFSNDGLSVEVVWYGGAKNPIFVNNGDVIRATLIIPIIKTVELTIVRTQPNLDSYTSLASFIQAVRPLVPNSTESEVIPDVIKLLDRNT